MKNLLLAASAVALTAGAATAQDAGAAPKIGIILGFTGPLESITPTMAQSAEIAIAEVNEAGGVNGQQATSERADSTCIDAAAATAAAEGLVSSGINAIMGADCSGVTNAVLTNVAVPNGIGMISPSATSPGLSTAEDNGLFFRTAPSDARQGQIMADILTERGVTNVALTYTNNDYGKGLADSFQAAFQEKGGTVAIVAPHEDGKADYSAEVAALAASGADMLVVAGYTDQGGRGIIQNALDTGAFDTFYLPDGMVGQDIVTALGSGLDSSYGDLPGTDSPGAAKWIEIAQAAGFDGTSSFAPESYDAAALILLSMAAAKSTNSADWTTKVLDLANAPGEQIFPGELGKALDLIAQGQDIDYEGASAVELIGAGESAGNYRELEFKDGQIETVKYR
ncbi:Branched-chain amino acid ABC transporter, amino acid-binding protein [Rubellimicrobium mesophilum DSM 19309]|uniref:Branched-chain amino acid ABC transporter, amino acid-binding protein n=1 Tax=Rubellimicrobium mesophilum DSM 19309 TaxID=442562 RepID=A0A017HGX7_9RHOB|nr:ABC transporter substrate-binding protein [Rubellimicrobium mesophilum]EYD73540.1 Branched-chain amino acid ABC transporter, amino acid-binding protein [Rubellimicrobium mesophilum DSM 19309]